MACDQLHVAKGPFLAGMHFGLMCTHVWRVLLLLYNCSLCACHDVCNNASSGQTMQRLFADNEHGSFIVFRAGFTARWSPRAKDYVVPHKVLLSNSTLVTTTVTVFVAINIWLIVTAVGDVISSAFVTSTVDLLLLLYLLIVIVCLYALCSVLCRTSGAQTLQHLYSMWMSAAWLNCHSHVTWWMHTGTHAGGHATHTTCLLSLLSNPNLHLVRHATFSVQVRRHQNSQPGDKCWVEMVDRCSMLVKLLWTMFHSWHHWPFARWLMVVVRHAV